MGRTLTFAANRMAQEIFVNEAQTKRPEKANGNNLYVQTVDHWHIHPAADINRLAVIAADVENGPLKSEFRLAIGWDVVCQLDCYRITYTNRLLSNRNEQLPKAALT